MTQSSLPLSPEALHRLAENILAKTPEKQPRDAADVQRLLHELQVHQIELEMQNEALHQMQAETQDALKRYADLNDRLEEIVAMRTSDLVMAREIAESANRAKSVFLANMSHELRTPMNAIMGMTDLALRRAIEPKQQDQLSKVMTASQHLLGIINDILDLSKIEAERLTLEKIPFVLGSVLENLNSLVGFKVQDKGLTLVIDMPLSLARQPLLGDPLRLGQILLNLTNNAVKFTATGRITIRVAAISREPDAVILRFDIEDTGIGIPAEVQGRLFSAFEQVDSSTTRKYGGTGLGLAISKRLAKMMEGSIGVTSSPGVGSVFWFTARVAQAVGEVAVESEQADATVEAELRSTYADARFLLVEDEPINREVSTALLEELGFKVDVAENGRQAVALAEQTDYDLILMDMQMPEMNGTDATRAIRRLPGREQTPILAMTANAFDEDRQQCLDAGMNDHVGKPVVPSRLYRVLLKWLSSRDRAQG